MAEESRYSDVNERLKEIVEEVSDETLPLDDALNLFEEAVALGVQATTLMEEDMAARDAERDAQEQAADEAYEASVADQDAPSAEGAGDAATAAPDAPAESADAAGAANMQNAAETQLLDADELPQ